MMAKRFLENYCIKIRNGPPSTILAILKWENLKQLVYRMKIALTVLLLIFMPLSVWLFWKSQIFPDVLECLKTVLETIESKNANLAGKTWGTYEPDIETKSAIGRIIEKLPENECLVNGTVCLYRRYSWFHLLNKGDGKLYFEAYYRICSKLGTLPPQKGLEYIHLIKAQIHPDGGDLLPLGESEKLLEDRQKSM